VSGSQFSPGIDRCPVCQMIMGEGDEIVFVQGQLTVSGLYFGFMHHGCCQRSGYHVTLNLRSTDSEKYCSPASDLSAYECLKAGYVVDFVDGHEFY
jgi:hypothetical protein